MANAQGQGAPSGKIFLEFINRRATENKFELAIMKLKEAQCSEAFKAVH